jgi:hypothetical protein
LKGYFVGRMNETTWKNTHSWVDNIKMYLNEIELQGVNWIHLAQDRDKWQAFVNMIMNLEVP